MSVIIVTKRCYLTCERVISIVIEETHADSESNDNERSWTFLGRKVVEPKPKPPGYLITVLYVPEVVAAITKNANLFGNQASQCSMEIYVSNEEDAFALFTEMVYEIQEQSPNDLYLDKLVAKVLKGA